MQNESNTDVNTSPAAGQLIFVGYPPTSPDDLTIRGLRALSSADVVFTREAKQAAQLLRHHNLNVSIVSIDEDDDVAVGISSLINEGKSVVYLGEGAYPSASDPWPGIAGGLAEHGIRPKIYPGVGVVVASLLASGYSTEGYDVVPQLPRRPEDRRAAAVSLARRRHTVAVVESPLRLRSLLAVLADVMPARAGAVIVNAATSSEGIVRASFRELLERFSTVRLRGEIVVLIAPESDNDDRQVVGDAVAATLGEEQEGFEWDPHAEQPAERAFDNRRDDRGYSREERPDRRRNDRPFERHSGDRGFERRNDRGFSRGGDRGQTDRRGAGHGFNRERDGGRFERREGGRFDRRDGGRFDRRDRGGFGERREGDRFEGRRDGGSFNRGGGSGFGGQRREGDGFNRPRSQGTFGRGDGRGFGGRRHDGDRFDRRRDDQGFTQGGDRGARREGADGNRYEGRRDDRRFDRGDRRDFGQRRDDRRFGQRHGERSFGGRRDEGNTERRGDDRGFSSSGDDRRSGFKSTGRDERSGGGGMRRKEFGSSRPSSGRPRGFGAGGQKPGRHNSGGKGRRR